MEEKPKRDFFLPASIIIAALLISFSLIYSVGKKSLSQEKRINFPNQVSSENRAYFGQIDLTNVPVLGNPEAPVTIIEYGDYQCPFCAHFFEEVEPLVKKEYIETGKAKFIYKDLAFLGPESILAAEATKCAQEQGKYWEFHDAIFEIEINEDLRDDGKKNGSSENSGNLTQEFFVNLARQFSLDSKAFQECLKSRKYNAYIEKDFNEARSIVPDLGTPLFFINNEIVRGFVPYSEFQKVLEKALKFK